MVRVAEQADARKFVFSGVYHPSIASMVNHAASSPSRRRSTAPPFVVLQPAMFMQTLAGQWSAVSNTARFSMPYSKDARLAYVDYVTWPRPRRSA